MYEIFEHTADLGIRVQAMTLPRLYEDAGVALMHVIAGDLGQIRQIESRRFEISGTDPAYLLFDWLNELLFTFEAARWLASRFEAAVDERGLVITAHGEPYDHDRHTLAHEVKAITYHGLDVHQDGQGWTGQVIVDI